VADLDGDGHIDLAVANYTSDVSGKKVRTVFSGRLNTGANKFVWNGRSDSGASIASGVYFCRLRSGNEIGLKRVILLR
jgi:flagellar hook assembly protein FlgD